MSSSSDRSPFASYSKPSPSSSFTSSSTSSSHLFDPSLFLPHPHLSELICCLCHHVCSNPWITDNPIQIEGEEEEQDACAHSFCKSCIFQSFENNNHSICPATNCHRPLTIKQIRSDVIARRQIADMQVCCPFSTGRNRENGEEDGDGEADRDEVAALDICYWVGSFGREGETLRAHIQQCYCRFYSCSYSSLGCEFECNEEEELQQHENDVNQTKIHLELAMKRCKIQAEHIRKLGVRVRELEKETREKNGRKLNENPINSALFQPSIGPAPPGFTPSNYVSTLPSATVPPIPSSSPLIQAVQEDGREIEAPILSKRAQKRALRAAKASETIFNESSPLSSERFSPISTPFSPSIPSSTLTSLYLSCSISLPSLSIPRSSLSSYFQSYEQSLRSLQASLSLRFLSFSPPINVWGNTIVWKFTAKMEIEGKGREREEEEQIEEGRIVEVERVRELIGIVCQVKKEDVKFTLMRNNVEGEGGESGGSQNQNENRESREDREGGRSNSNSRRSSSSSSGTRSTSSNWRRGSEDHNGFDSPSALSRSVSSRSIESPSSLTTSPVADSSKSSSCFSSSSSSSSSSRPSPSLSLSTPTYTGFSAINSYTNQYVNDSETASGTTQTLSQRSAFITSVYVNNEIAPNEVEGEFMVERETTTNKNTPTHSTRSTASISSDASCSSCSSSTVVAVTLPSGVRYPLHSIVPFDCADGIRRPMKITCIDETGKWLTLHGLGNRKDYSERVVSYSKRLEPLKNEKGKGKMEENGEEEAFGLGEGGKAKAEEHEANTRKKGKKNGEEVRLNEQNENRSGDKNNSGIRNLEGKKHQIHPNVGESHFSHPSLPSSSSSFPSPSPSFSDCDLISLVKLPGYRCVSINSSQCPDFNTHKGCEVVGCKLPHVKAANYRAIKTSSDQGAGTNPCPKFMVRGECRRGNKCTYRHEMRQ